MPSLDEPRAPRDHKNSARFLIGREDAILKRYAAVVKPQHGGPVGHIVPAFWETGPRQLEVRP